jgi:hypothetical protein
MNSNQTSIVIQASCLDADSARCCRGKALSISSELHPPFGVLSASCESLLESLLESRKFCYEPFATLCSPSPLGGQESVLECGECLCLLKSNLSRGWRKKWATRLHFLKTSKTVSLFSVHVWTVFFCSFWSFAASCECIVQLCIMCIRLLHDNVMSVIIENGSCLVLKPNGSKVADGLTPPTLSDLFGP